jgi:hypothetical protein
LAPEGNGAKEADVSHVSFDGAQQDQTSSSNASLSDALGVSGVSTSFCVGVDYDGNAAITTDPTAATPTEVAAAAWAACP